MATQNQQPGSHLAMFNKDVAEAVSQKILQLQTKNEIHFPVDYSVENALKSAWLTLQSTKDKNDKPVLEVCTQDSIADAMLDMVIQGLNPSKSQCYFAAYGNKLACQRMYFGNMAIAKMVDPNIQDIDFQAVYKDDVFEYSISRGSKKIEKHLQKLDNVDPAKITAAYCTVVFKDGSEKSEIMTMAQIIQAWKQGPNYKEGGAGVHQKFTADMATKTVVNKTCKPIIKASNDKTLLQSFHRSEEIETEHDAEQDAAANANTGEVIDIHGKVQPDSHQPPTPENKPKEAEKPF